MSDRKIPFGVTLTCCAALCAFFWVMTFLFPIYVGAAAVCIGTACLYFWLIIKIRQAFAFGSRRAVDFINGIESRKKEALQKERLEAVRVAVSEAQARKEAASKDLKQPNQSSVVREINKAIFALKTEQLRLEYAALRRDVEAK